MPGLGAEAMIFLYAGLSGLTVLAGYDVLRWFRRIIRHHDFLVGVEDILYSVAVSIYLFRQLYVTTYPMVFYSRNPAGNVVLEKCENIVEKNVIKSEKKP